MAASGKNSPRAGAAPRVARMAPDARRKQFLHVALDLFAARGYHATSISHIIGKAGVARGTFYQYFRSKKEIFDSLLDELFSQVNAAVAPIEIAAPVNMARAVRANIESLCRTLQQIIGTRSFAVGRLVDEIFQSVQQGVLLVRFDVGGGG